MRASDKVVVVEREDRVSRVEEFRVKDDFNAVRGMIEELDAADLIQDRVIIVVNHVVRYNWGKGVAFHGEQATAEHDTVGGGEDVFILWEVVAFVPLQGAAEEAFADFMLDDVDGVAEGFDDCLAFECFDGERLSLRGHDDESDDCHFRAGSFEAMVQAGQGLDKHVHPFVAVLVSPSGEEIKSVIGVKVVVAVEVPSHEVVDLLLVLLMQVLEFMHCGKLLDIQSIGQHAVWLAFQQMLGFVGRNM